MKRCFLFLTVFIIITVNLSAQQWLEQFMQKWTQQLSLKDVIEHSARGVEGALGERDVVAMASFTSPTIEFTDYVIEEITGELVKGQKVVVVDRRNLDQIRKEIDFQYSGDVSDESLAGIGKMLGAKSIVCGSLTNMGQYYRFRVKVISVETAEILTQISLNLKNDSQVSFLLTDDSESPSYFAVPVNQKIAVGTATEINMNSTLSPAAAFGLMFSGDYTINEMFAAGLNMGFSFSNMFTYEFSGMFRWYFYSIFFAQADMGLWVSTHVEPMFLIGARAGARMPVSRNFWVEPYIRLGIPYSMGVGVAGGIRLPMLNDNAPVGGIAPKGSIKAAEELSFADQVQAIVREYKDDHIWLEFDSEGRLRLMVSVIFGANSAEFDGLSPEIMANNERTLRYVADILKRTRYSSIIIEGYSNPTQPEGPARAREENELRMLSRLRALTVVDELRQYGVNLDRRSVQGAGSSRLVAPYNDPQNNWKNRRVEFILIQ